MASSKKVYKVKNLLCKDLNLIAEEKGKLDLTVYHEEYHAVLPNATVKIYRVSVTGEYREIGKGVLIHEFVTDENGKIPVVELPILNDLMPDNTDFYYIAVHSSNHYSAYIFNAEIFPNITTNFNVSLEYIYSNEEFFQFIMQPTRSEIIKKQESTKYNGSIWLLSLYFVDYV